MRTCSSCGNSEPDSSHFCGSCGSALQTPAPASSGASDTESLPGAAVASAPVPDAEPTVETTRLDPGTTIQRRAARSHRRSRRGADRGSDTVEHRRSRRRIAFVAPALALLVAAAAVLGIVLTTNSGPARARTAGSEYRQKLGSALGPMVRANQALSTALQALDGSKSTVAAVRTATAQAQTALAAARGATSVLTVPSAETTLSQQAEQALTEENGYLQGVAATLSNPAGGNASQLRPLITAAQSAMVPLGQVAPEATTSLTGVDNVISWAASARTVKHAAPRTIPQAQPATTTTPSSSPSSSPSGLTACDQNISVNSNTSCSFADSVFTMYAQAVQMAGGPSSQAVDAYSSATGQSYTDNCQYNPTTQIVLCSHGSDLIQFPYWAAEVYQPQG